jgi:hypothetical protein
MTEGQIGNLDYEPMIRAVVKWCEAHGIRVQEGSLAADKVGEFTGRHVLMNRDFEPADRLFYLTHAIGSIVLWSRDRQKSQQVFTELRDAKKSRESQSDRLERAIERFRLFEIQASELAVWLLDECRCPDAISCYTNYMRADLEAMTVFHRTGTAPMWHNFFRKWNAEVSAGKRRVEAFQAKPIPPLQPIEFEKQEIMQR